jgi:hypothetical protein
LWHQGVSEKVVLKWVVEKCLWKYE